MKNVCVFLSASPVPQVYIAPAKKFARLLVKHKYNFIWGGTDKGLMKIVSDEIKKNGGKTIGITTEFLKDSRKKDADAMIITKDFSARKKLMCQKSNAFVVLVGGIGTIDEITELLELKKHRFHDKPIIFLNTNNFYSGLKQQLIRMEKEGFLPRKLNQLVFFADSPKTAIEYLNTHLSNRLSHL